MSGLITERTYMKIGSSEDIDLKRFYEDILGRQTVKASIPLETTTCLNPVANLGRSSWS